MTGSMGVDSKVAFASVGRLCGSEYILFGLGLIGPVEPLIIEAKIIKFFFSSSFYSFQTVHVINFSAY